jgi:thioredoxin reductase
MKKTKVIIAGCGFAGLSAAMYLDKTLARRENTESALLNEDQT